jgi:hypothetical protein
MNSVSGILLCCIGFAAELTKGIFVCGSEEQSLRSLCFISAGTGVKIHATSCVRDLLRTELLVEQEESKGEVVERVLLFGIELGSF